MNPNRQPKGVPTGGQFATSARQESPVALDAGQPSEERLVRRFACERHDAPGACTPECVDLAGQMSPNPDVDFDPTGTSYGPPRPYRTYEYDEQARASVAVTHLPAGITYAWTAEPGSTLRVGDAERTVAAVSEPRLGQVEITFTDDGTPSQVAAETIWLIADPASRR